VVMIARRQRDESKEFFFFLIVLAEKARVSRTLSDMRAERFYFIFFFLWKGKEFGWCDEEEREESVEIEGVFLSIRICYFIRSV
jgi:hypothetical protein